MIVHRGFVVAHHAVVLLHKGVMPLLYLIMVAQHRGVIAHKGLVLAHHLLMLLLHLVIVRLSTLVKVPDEEGQCQDGDYAHNVPGTGAKKVDAMGVHGGSPFRLGCALYGLGETENVACWYVGKFLAVTFAACWHDVVPGVITAFGERKNVILR